MARISLTPIIDVVFILLIFFMLASNFNKIGELKIKELRKFASQELGQNFDLREFHDTILWSGELPLDLLEQNIKNWIEVKKAS